MILLQAFTSISRAQGSLLSYRHASRAPTFEELMQWREVFRYEVKYSFIKLGEVKTEIIRDTVYNGEHAWHLQTIITSASNIPFVGKEENHYNSIIVNADSLPHTLFYWTDNVDEHHYRQSRYLFDYVHKKVYGKEQDMPPDTLSLEEPASSGQLIFYLGRLFAGTDQPYTLPVYLDLKKGYIHVKNFTRRVKRSYEAFPMPVEVFYSEGETTIDGPFGFSGKFRAWFLADDLRVPLEAHVRVWLGNVKIRLIDYKKELRK